MNRYRITLFALALALPGLAWSRPTAQEACDSLKTKAVEVLGVTDALRCQAQEEKLTVEVSTLEAFEKLRAAAFPRYKYEGFSVARPIQTQGLRDAAASAPSGLALGETAKSMTVAINFDGSAAAKGGAFMTAGPPGSMPPGAEAPKKELKKKGPPGATPPGATPPGRPAAGRPAAGRPAAGPPGATPPGSQPPATRPPSTRPPGNDAPPSSSPPPSRPTPVFVPQAPQPNYWNTIDWGTVPMWADLPSDWEQSRFDEQNNRYVTRWYAYSRPFVSDIGQTKDSKSITRRTGMDVINMSLISRQVIETKQCYYQGVYDLRWNSFEGRWDGRFSHYRAACRRAEDYGPGIMRDVRVGFVMQGRSLMPWETEVVHGTFDGRNVGVRVDYPAYQYTEAPGGMPGYVTFHAGAKLLTSPDKDGVTAELVPNGQAFKLRVFDKWAGYYAGETLEVSMKLIYVTSGWFTKNEIADNRAFEQGNQIRWTPAAPAGAPGSGGGFEESLTTKGCGTYFIESWSFRRGNNSRSDNKSLISSDAIIHKGGSQRIKLCK